MFVYISESRHCWRLFFFLKRLTGFTNIVL